jgi:hypothetical protein
MNKISLFTLCLIYLLNTTSSPQQFNYPKPDEGNIAGGLGLNWIDGKPHYRIGFQPEISFMNFGVGLDLALDFESSGKLRNENFNEFSDYLSVIRYIRYGLKNEPVYIRLGSLGYYSLGHGTIMNNYNNSPTFDNRRIGLIADINFGKFGFESIYSSFGQAGVMGVRGYILPIQFTSAAELPIISNLEFGLSLVSDFNNLARVDSGLFDTKGEFKVIKDGGDVSFVGFDIGLPLLKSASSKILLYFDYNKMIDFGSGIATGVQFNFNGLGLISLSSKLERRINNGKYLAAYFNSLYEIERFKGNVDLNTYSTKVDLVNSINENQNGYYGDILVRVLNLFDILGSYQRLDKAPNSGILNLRTSIEPENASFVLRAGYDKINIKDEKDLFKLDDRSYLFAELGYKPIEYILVSMIYNWTFTPIRDNNENIIRFEPQKRIEPRISFMYPFKF